MPGSKRRHGGKRPRRGTGRPSGKDRSAHEASRGKKMISLSDLANELPSEGDLAAYLKMLEYETDDRGCAIMGASFVEHCLEVAIRCRIMDPGDETAELWFKGINAPFKTFSAKIQLGMAVCIYGPEMHARLSSIKDIRNVFAHRALPLEFSHPSIIASIKKVAPFVEGSFEDNWKLVFATGCISLADSLIFHAHVHAGRQLNTSYP